MCAIDALGISAMTGLPVSHPQITGGILDQDRALEMGIGIFGQLFS